MLFAIAAKSSAQEFAALGPLARLTLTLPLPPPGEQRVNNNVVADANAPATSFRLTGEVPSIDFLSYSLRRVQYA
jgi:hypothetical protein